MGFKPFKPPLMPAYQPYNMNAINADAVKADTANYARSDADFAKRHAPTLQAEKLFEAQTLKDQQGENEFMPQVQSEYMRSGLSKALDAFGDVPGTLAPNSAGEATVARNLGLDILSFQDRNRTNRQNSLGVAEQIFPRRSIGLSGQDAALLDMLNNMGTNNWNQADFATRFQTKQLNYTNKQAYNNAGVQQDNLNAQAAAQKKSGQDSALISGGAGIASAAILALALSCWIARLVFGEDLSEWRVFRHWMLSDSPNWFRVFYLTNGKRIADVVSKSNAAKAAIKWAFSFAVSARRREWAHAS